MKQSDIFRLAGLVTVIAGLWTAGSAFLSFETTPGWVFFVGTVLSVFALFAVYAAQAESSAIWGLVGFVAATVGNILFLGEDIWGELVFAIGGGLYALGLILLGVGTLKAGVFSRWAAWLWIASVVLGIPGFAVQSLMALFFAAGGVALGAGFVLAGYELWAGRSGVTAAANGE